MSGTNLRFINALVLILFCVLGLTGLYGLVWPFPSFLFQIHRIAGWALILLIPWKSVISWRSLRRGWSNRFDRSVMVVISSLLAIATIVVLILALFWTWQLGPYYVWIGPIAYSGIGWHWGIAIGLAPFFIIHAWRRWPRPKRTDFVGRRQALKLMGLGAAAIVGWSLSETLAKSIAITESQRRFTGSREEGSFTGNRHPVTTATGQGLIKVDPDQWTLQVRGLVQKPITLSYKEVLDLSTSEVTAILDCTGGWYTLQTWRGIQLRELLTQAQIRSGAIGLILRGIADYTAFYTFAQADEILLATYVGGETLTHVHGFPMRAVVPSRRGWQWVKWLTEIEVL